MNGNSGNVTGDAGSSQLSATTVDASVVVLDDKNDEDESPRRQSQSSNHSRTTASVNDLSMGGGDEDEDISRVPSASSESGISHAATIDVTVDNGSGRASCYGSETSGGSRSCTQSQMQMVEWTKGFHNLVEIAPLLKTTLISGEEDHVCNLQNGKGDDADGRRGYCEALRQTCKEKQQKNGDEDGDKASGAEKTETCDWIDRQLLEEGRRFVRRNFFAIFLAHFIGIAFLLTVRPIQAILLRTSALHRKENTLRRYVKLILYLKRFYESPEAVLKTGGQSSDSNADISYIHRLQRNAAKNFKVYVPPPYEDLKLTLEEQEIYQAVQEDTKQLDNQHGICTDTKVLPKILFTVNPDVPMSQYDLVIIQHAFFGMIAQFPRVFGIYDKCDRDGKLKGISGFIHMWAVLGHIFGIEERFNLCLSKNYDPETNQLIFRQVFLFSFKTLNESTLRLWRSMTKGSSRYFFFFRTKAMMLFMCKDVAQLDNCKNLYSVMKPMEKFCYYYYKFLLDWILWVPPFRVLFNISINVSICICQHYLQRAKKYESKWDGAPSSVCVIDN